MQSHIQAICDDDQDPFDLILDEIEAKFLHFLPPAELKVPRLFSHLQYAFWHYLDFYSRENPEIYPTIGEHAFARTLYDRPFLTKEMAKRPAFQQAYSKFKDYMKQVKRYGCIPVCEGNNKVCQVTFWGQKKGWHFLRGKVDQNETPIQCAVRETFEEIGLDITPYLPEDPSKLVDIDGFFVIGNIPRDYPFATRTREEVGQIAWRSLSHFDPNQARDIRRGLKHYFELMKESSSNGSNINTSRRGGGGGQEQSMEEVADLIDDFEREFGHELLLDEEEALARMDEIEAMWEEEEGEEEDPRPVCVPS